MSSSEFQFRCVDGGRKPFKPCVMLKARRKTFIREWRSHRNLTQEQLAERVDMSPGNLSLIERGLQNYTQDTLESLANALQCGPADLLMRNPLDGEAIWSIWDRAKPGERRMIVDIAKTIIKTGT
jgi:transcriptional regulator with XRE-family HTH domain